MHEVDDVGKPIVNLLRDTLKSIGPGAGENTRTLNVGEDIKICFNVVATKSKITLSGIVTILDVECHNTNLTIRRNKGGSTLTVKESDYRMSKANKSYIDHAVRMKNGYWLSNYIGYECTTLHDIYLSVADKLELTLDEVMAVISADKKLGYHHQHREYGMHMSYNSRAGVAFTNNPLRDIFKSGEVGEHVFHTRGYYINNPDLYRDGLVEYVSQVLERQAYDTEMSKSISIHMMETVTKVYNDLKERLYGTDDVGYHMGNNAIRDIMMPACDGVVTQEQLNWIFENCSPFKEKDGNEYTPNRQIGGEGYLPIPPTLESFITANT